MIGTASRVALVVNLMPISRIYWQMYLRYVNQGFQRHYGFISVFQEYQDRSAKIKCAKETNCDKEKVIVGPSQLGK